MFLLRGAVVGVVISYLILPSVIRYYSQLFFLSFRTSFFHSFFLFAVEGEMNLPTYLPTSLVSLRP